MTIRRKNPPKVDSTASSSSADTTPATRPRIRRKSTEKTSSEAVGSDAESYQVGYGSPPRETQFKKGKSGNPNGRPKGAKGLNTIVKENLLQRVPVRTATGTKRITRIAALVHKLVEAASKGDHRALVHLMAVYSSAVPDTDHEKSDNHATELTQTDEEILARFLAQAGGRKASL